MQDAEVGGGLQRGWSAFKIGVLGVQVRNQDLHGDHLRLLRHAVEDAKMQGVPASPAA